MFEYTYVFTELANPNVPINRGIVEVDCDTNAELLTVMDRDSMLVIITKELSSSKIVSITLPESYATTKKVLLIIADNDGEYNAKALDGVSAELVNVRQIE